ncbi:MAG: hypothetical protein HY584_00045, partial [Candidatus Omnitrophica bacterium]|nr:hypothetical protein [Candidatus Omnitrophota bacterium]
MGSFLAEPINLILDSPAQLFLFSRTGINFFAFFDAGFGIDSPGVARFRFGFFFVHRIAPSLRATAGWLSGGRPLGLPVPDGRSGEGSEAITWARD